MNKRLNIGFFIHHLDNDYSKSLLNGVCAAAEDFDVNAVIYPGRSLNAESHMRDKVYAAFEYQYNILYEYANKNCLDGLIISAGTIGQFITKEELKAFVDKYSDIPLLVIENEVAGYPCVNFGADGIKQVINHLANDHSCKNIAFVSGPLSNSDAVARLEAYKDGLFENGIDYDDALVRYGDFSEFCDGIVKDLVTNCGKKLDAICFANDQMCIGGYKALRELGLEPGKDILVTGYDDSEVACSLDPMLTTVGAEASVLGYVAVEKMVRHLRTGEPVESEELSATVVTRGSCGCHTGFSNENKVVRMVDGMTAEECASAVTNAIVGHDFSMSGNAKRSMIVKFLSDVFSVFDGGGDISIDMLDNSFDRLLESDALSNISNNSVIQILQTAQAVSVFRCGNVASRKLKIVSCFESFFCILSEHFSNQSAKKQTDMTATHFLISNLTKDMMLNSETETNCYHSIINNLYRCNLRSAYIYIFNEEIEHIDDQPFEKPDSVMLKAYSIDKDLFTLSVDDQTIAADDIINNRFTPDRRRTMVLAPLFSNADIYGLVLFELDFKYFTLVYSIIPQICTAIRLNGLIRRLEASLLNAENTNTMLSHISMTDELTGIYNRRGFYVNANSLINDKNNVGKRAVLIFGDLDNLKKINDTFGHDDGDYAIRTCAAVLKGSIRNSDIIARIGGDEFAAIALVDEADEDTAEGIYDRAKALAEVHNKGSEKDYNVTISIGTYVLECSEELKVQTLMDKADNALYEDKHKKNHDIMKAK